MEIQQDGEHVVVTLRDGTRLVLREEGEVTRGEWRLDVNGDGRLKVIPFAVNHLQIAADE